MADGGLRVKKVACATFLRGLRPARPAKPVDTTESQRGCGPSDTSQGFFDKWMADFSPPSFPFGKNVVYYAGTVPAIRPYGGAG